MSTESLALLLTPRSLAVSPQRATHLQGLLLLYPCPCPRAGLIPQAGPDLVPARTLTPPCSYFPFLQASPRPQTPQCPLLSHTSPPPPTWSCAPESPADGRPPLLLVGSEVSELLGTEHTLSSSSGLFLCLGWYGPGPLLSCLHMVWVTLPPELPGCLKYQAKSLSQSVSYWAWTPRNGGRGPWEQPLSGPLSQPCHPALPCPCSLGPVSSPPGFLYLYP